MVTFSFPCWKNIMKRIFVLFILLISAAQFSVAQQDTAALRKKLFDTICNCAAKADTSGIKSMDDVKKIIMDCFTVDGMPVFLEYVKAKGFDMKDEAAGRALGEIVGKELMGKCRTFKNLMKKALKENGQLPAEESPKKNQ